MSEEDLRELLRLGEAVGSSVALVERAADGSLRSLSAAEGHAGRRVDPFCAFFRHGEVDGRLAFPGADAACAHCEERLVASASEVDATGGSLAPENPEGRRCHMGLTDFRAPVTVGNVALGELVAGRVVRADAERERVRKIVTRLGTLTRAERASSRGDGPGAIVPASEKARKRLLAEIPDIPLASDELPARLRDFARRLAAIAERCAAPLRARCETEVLVAATAYPAELPATVSALRRTMNELLEDVRRRLELAFVVLFGREPRELDGDDARPVLVAHAGLGKPARPRALALDWNRLAPELELTDLGARGRHALSAAVTALVVEAGAPAELKDRLTKGMFLVPLTLGARREGAALLGPAQSDVPPDADDWAFLGRLGRELLRAWYALATEVDRRWLATQLETAGSRASRLASSLREKEAADREARLTKGFSRFDAARLWHAVAERGMALAAERGVELDTRAMTEKTPLYAHRGQVEPALERLLAMGIERTHAVDTEHPAPLRLLLRRQRGRIVFAVEAIGDYLPVEERDRLLGGAGGDAPSGDDAAASSGRERRCPPEVGILFKMARRHRGRFKIETERLRRANGAPGRWVGKTTFVLELPEVTKSSPGSGGRGAAHASEGNRKHTGNPS